MTFDEVRTRFPGLRMALYALEPGGDVTLEVIAADGEIFTFTAGTAQDALDRAFGADTPPEPDQPGLFD